MRARTAAKSGDSLKKAAYTAVHMQHTHEVQWKAGKAPDLRIQSAIHAALHRDGAEPHKHAFDTAITEDQSLSNETGFHTVDNYKPKPYDGNGEAADENVICPNCGKGDADDARYCDQCGFKLVGADGVKVKQ